MHFMPWSNNIIPLPTVVSTQSISLSINQFESFAFKLVSRCLISISMRLSNRNGKNKRKCVYL